jgi:predicted aldo/keto reductase-like oxidoreductase
VLDQLEAFAAARSRPLVELAFAWLLAHPQVSSVIAGATTPDQITTNAKAVDWHLSAPEMEELDGILGAGGMSYGGEKKPDSAGSCWGTTACPRTPHGDAGVGERAPRLSLCAA